MSSTQIAAQYRSVHVSILAILLVAAFAVGAIAGLGVPRSLGSTTPASAAAAAQTVGSTAQNNMSDATRDAQFAPANTTQGIPVVANNNMSDATHGAQFGGK